MADTFDLLTSAYGIAPVDNIVFVRIWESNLARLIDDVSGGLDCHTCCARRYFPSRAAPGGGAEQQGDAFAAACARRFCARQAQKATRHRPIAPPIRNSLVRMAGT